MKPSQLTLAVAARPLPRPAQPARSTAAPRRDAGLDLHRQPRHLLRLPLPRHLADQQEAGHPGRLRLRAQHGIYLGNWNSNVDSAHVQRRQLEMDFYGGYKTTIGDFGLDLGAIYYYYPGTGDNPARSRSTTPSSTSAAAGARSR